jgi:steroid Delta-isomerase
MNIVSTTSPSHLQRLSDFYTQITVESVPMLRELYAHDAYFKDPFNEVQGIDNIVKIFSHMFIQIAHPRFEVLSCIGSARDEKDEADEAFLVWLFYWKKDAQGNDAPPIRGSSHVKFNSLGRVTFHRDYWDAAEELYETIPLLGSMLRFVKKKLKAT